LKSFEYNGINWKIYHGALIHKTAPHAEINLNSTEAQELLKKSKAYFLRYTNNFDLENIESEFWYIIKDQEETLEQYNSSKRNQIKKGLKNCFVQKVSNEEIANKGYEVYIKAFHNYETNLLPLSQEAFYNNTINAKDCDFFAVYENESNIMIAYSTNHTYDNMVNYTTIKFHPQYLKLYPSYALFYEMNRYYINDLGFKYVNDGARSISHATNIQDFLIQKFNFRKAYCKLNIIYRWDIGLMVKVLYPFKTIFNKFNNKIFNKISVLLRQEEIRRKCESVYN